MALLSSLDGSKLELDFGSAKWSQYRTNLSRLSLFLFAVTCGVSVANIYYAQPSLDAIAASFAIEPGRIGIVVTLTHVGYVLGLLFLVPLGDILDRRKLIIGQTLLSTGALAIVGTAPTATIFLIGMIAVGLLGVVVQSLVALTATLASPHERGQSVGFVTAGVITGILGARFISGALADMGGWRLVYLVSAGLMLCLSLLLMRVLPRHIQRARSENYLAILRSMPGLFLRDPLLRSRAILAFLVFASFSTLWTAMVLPLSAQSLSHTQIGLFGFAGLAGALAASGAGRLADRGLGNWTTVAALVLLTVSWLPISLLSSSPGPAGSRRCAAGPCGAGCPRYQPEPHLCRPCRVAQSASGRLYDILFPWQCGRRHRFHNGLRGIELGGRVDARHRVQPHGTCDPSILGDVTRVVTRCMKMNEIGSGIRQTRAAEPTI